ncbi:type III-A CRISPR-associated protein Csm2 [Sulfuriflexus sp.]|uniref:type III-A CRISPR-associated protein Csm2 n=1 Tax=Sulfuriflexus sp. TaxID=2015443 RepID=UPI0028CF45B8|nr:type III-A CRISPR-associated protein Csm2 [Sulfuriflexus sp.]MDT8405447.1 type III-A CRISPR-associated protein Csm2 [Sulfuriflexus sp.]
MIYFDDTGKHIRPELLNEEALKAAEQFVELNANGRPTNEAIKSSQLRRFFNEFKSLERQFEQQQGDVDDAFKSIKPLIKMANAKVVYAQARKVVPQAFVTWLQKHVQAIETARDFKAFLLHFEAVVGFCYGRNLKD